ncbi:hypothetical protein ASF41_10460 [Methylobacterium sp. Leaf111]|uniref:hypothetical protein n=1 Tax=Methylobacterium sp. Leaf111 TaxID=1736257 RepID=UPI0006F6CE8F|nr:hypothetical protein [Methylobacterium sp. Leaf111]KQP60091.1 hypothetical protein ASF41_10460 [Methylobacterium sp. Leaf111]
MPLYRTRAPVINLDDGLSAIGKAFAPPTPQEVAVMQRGQEAARKATSIEAIRNGSRNMGDFFGSDVADPVRQYAIADLYGRSQAPGARPQDLDTSNFAIHGNAGNTFAGLDVNNRASMARTQVEQQGQTIRELLKPVGKGDSRFVPPTVASAFGTAPIQTGVVQLSPGEQANLPDGRVLSGVEKPMTKAEVEGGILQRQPSDVQDAAVLSGIPVETVMTSEGAKILYRNNAVGKAPAPDAAAKPELRNYKAGDRTGTARYDASQGWVDAQTGEKLPANITTFTSQLSGTADETGLGSTAKNNVEQSLVDAANVESTAKALGGLIDANPASQGIMGLVRGAGQDIAAVAREGGKLFSPAFQQMQKDIAQGVVDPEIAAQMQTYDPSIPQIRLYEMLLAGQVAKMIDPNGRISNDRMKQVTESLGGAGWLSNADRTKASLAAVQNMVKNRRDMLRGTAPEAAAIGQTSPSLPPAAAATPPPPPSGSGEGTIIENDAGQRMVKRGGKWEPL